MPILPWQIHGNDNARRPNYVDVRIGARLRALRHADCESLEQFANKLGISDRQLQKYEVGVNRIAAATLYQFSRILNVPLAHFFAADDDGLDVSQSTALTTDETPERPSSTTSGRVNIAPGGQSLPEAPSEVAPTDPVTPFTRSS